MTPTDDARSFRSHEVVASRRDMLRNPHIVQFTDFVETLRKRHPNWEFPNFDPLDGGVNADILFLFEKPGRMTSVGGGGSGFISRDNDDSTAEATFRFMNDASLPRKRTVIWNVIPGWNGTRRITASERHEGLCDLKNLLKLLPRLRTVVLVGRQAQRARLILECEYPKIEIICSAHPSPLVRASRLDEWKKIPLKWAEANSPAQI
jgi:hypothetical protein